MLTVAEVAERYKCGVEKILKLIGCGAIRAVDTGVSRSRPSWLISAQALEEFERGRSNVELPEPKRKRRKRIMENSEQFF
jgi:excisionase family DNA binding protein